MGMDKDSPSPGFIFRLNPALKKGWLYALSGVMWSGVGLFLCSLTIEWFRPVKPVNIYFSVLAGCVLAFVIFKFGFSGFALRNIKRIEMVPKEKVCLFAFQRWTSYPLVLFMISLGIFLRKYSPIPKLWLGILYIGIGGSLFFASFHYYSNIFSKDRDG
jgi:hypothetical protein